MQYVAGLAGLGFGLENYLIAKREKTKWQYRDPRTQSTTNKTGGGDLTQEEWTDIVGPPDGGTPSLRRLEYYPGFTLPGPIAPDDNPHVIDIDQPNYFEEPRYAEPAAHHVTTTASMAGKKKKQQAQQQPQSKAAKGAAKRKRKREREGKLKVIKSLRDPVTGADFAIEETEIRRCMVNYLCALANPFKAAPCCAPYAPFTESGQYVCWARGTAYIGTQGVGGITLNPCMASDDNVGIASDTGFAQTTIPNFHSGAALAGEIGVRVGCSQVKATYGNSAITAQGRLVGFACRIRNTAEQQLLKGNVYTLVHPDHQDLSSFTSGNLAKYKECTIRSFANRSWHSIVWTPVNSNETRPSGSPWYNFDENGNPLSEQGPMGIMVEGTAGQPFYYEVFMIFENFGAIMNSPSPIHGDPSLSARVLEGIRDVGSLGLQKASNLAGMKLREWANGWVDKTTTAMVAQSLSAASVYLTGRHQRTLTY